MSAPPPPRGDFELAVSVARVEVKLDNLTSTVNAHSQDLAALKDRRFPLASLGILFAGVGGACGMYAAVRGH
jgi:hypothetical protein